MVPSLFPNKIEVDLSSQKRFLSIEDLTSMPAPVWMIDGLFEANSLVMVAGPPGCYKSFMILDWILCMATGRNWGTRKTAPGRVLYVLGEGKASLFKRINAWAAYHKLDEQELKRLEDNFWVTFEVPQMASKASVDNMMAAMEQEKIFPTVIVIDTFARSFVGMDENSQRDTGLWIESADRLRQLGYTVIFLHHTAKNTEFGLKYRGSSAIMGAMDTAMTMNRDGSASRVKLAVVKQKDHDEGEPLYFQRQIVKDGYGDEGSVVLTPTVRVDDDFSPANVVQATIEKLMSDDSFKSDAERARSLALSHNLSEAAAKVRLSRARGHAMGGEFVLDLNE